MLKQVYHTEQQLYHHTLQLINDAAFWMKRSGLFYKANQAALDMLGYTEHEFREKTVFDVNVLVNNDNWGEIWDELREKSSFSMATKLKAKDGSLISVMMNANYIKIGGEEYSCCIVRDLTKGEKHLNILKKLTEGTSTSTGIDFFKQLAIAITDVLNVRYVTISECANLEKTTVRTLAFADRQLILENIEYDVAGTPCFIVMKGKEYLHPKGLRKKYEKYQGLEAYFGLPITDYKGNVIGHIGVLNDEFYKPDEVEKEVLRIFANRAGAELERKIAMDELKILKDKLEEENIYLKEEIKSDHNFEEIITDSDVYKKQLLKVDKVAPTDSTVLLRGETGTGKELVARAIHNHSPRKQKPFVKINCAALPSQLIESELFGHEKGAFTGAINQKKGKFELADTGTLFLDEIGELPTDLQSKLLRALQEGEIERLGGTKTIKVNVRIIAATNRDLEKEIHQSKFRADLFFRLNVFPIVCPPLRERPEDIPVLAKHFARKFSKKIGRDISSISQSTLNKLKLYDWPGNVRELENLVERAVILSENKTLSIEEGFIITDSNREGIWQMQEMERCHIIKALEHRGWKVSGEKGAANLLGLKPTTLEARMKKLGIKRPF